MRQMVRLHYVILLLIQVIRNDDLVWVLLRINRVLLQADVNLTEAHRRRVGYGLNYQKTGKELMSRDELAVMDGEKCILQLRGVRPFLSNKYDITKHKRYKELADFNKNNAFDVEKYLAHRLVMSEDTEFEMYEVTVTQEDVSAIEAEEGED